MIVLKLHLLPLIAVGLLVVFAASATPKSRLVPELAVDQVWSIKSTPPTTAKVIISRIEPWHGKVVVHISVIDVPIPQGVPGVDGVTVISHMPFEKSALAASVDQLLATNASPVPNFQSGYEKWRADNKAGIYTIGVSQAIQLLFETLSRGRG